MAKKNKPKIDKRLALLDRVNTQNPSNADIKAFREFEKEMHEYWGLQGGFVHQTELKIFESMDCTFLTEEMLKSDLRSMRDGLGWDTASEIEKILIKQCCLNWLRLNLLERVHNTKTTDSHTTESGLYWDKRLDAANRRFTRTVESLAKVRKLLAEADAKDAQARVKRTRAAQLSQNLLKQLT